ncbi:acyl-CoA dehydrogenase family protein [Streptomyces albidoflavus]
MTRPPEAVPEPVRAARELAARWLLPAAAWDRSEGLPREVAGDLARAGLLAPDVPAEYGGAGTGQQELGEVCATLGGVCGAVRGLVTVQGMVAAGLRRWGTPASAGHGSPGSPPGNWSPPSPPPSRTPAALSPTWPPPSRRTATTSW